MHLKICYEANPEGAKTLAVRDRFLIVMDDGSEIDISTIVGEARPVLAVREVKTCQVTFLGYELAPLTPLEFTS